MFKNFARIFIRHHLKLIFILFYFFSILLISSVAEIKNWSKFGSSWEFKDSKVLTLNSNPVYWGYYELTNYNTILSLLDYKKYSSLDITSTLYDRMKTPSEFIISFAVTAESQSWFYHMYAFKLTGGYWGMNKASFIHSDRLDKSKPLNTKNNTFVKELASAKCSVKYDKMYSYRVSFEGENVVLYINDEKILSAPFPEKSHDGRIAISARNVKIAVDKVTVKKGDETVFEDDFNKDSILIKKLKAEKVPAGETEKVQEKKK